MYMTVTKAEKIKYNILISVLIGLIISIICGSFVFYNSTIVFQAEQRKINESAKIERCNHADEITILRQSDSRYMTSTGVKRSLKPYDVKIENLKEAIAEIKQGNLRVEDKLDRLIERKTN